MLTIKNRIGRVAPVCPFAVSPGLLAARVEPPARSWRKLAGWLRPGALPLLFVALVLFAGCTPSGSRALLDGKRLIDKGQYAQAVEKLKAATTLLGGSNALAWSYLGLAYQHSGALPEASWAYQRALALNPAFSEVRFDLGCLALSQNRLEEARNQFTAYTLAERNDPRGYVKLGTMQLRAREPSAAEKNFNEALRLNQQNPEAWNGLGMARLQRGRTAEATQAFESALEQQRNYAPALLNLAIVAHQYIGNKPLALQRYREVLALKPPPPNADALTATVRQLEREVNPTPRWPATNAFPVAASVTHTTKPPAAATAKAVKAPKAETAAEPARLVSTNPTRREPVVAAPKAGAVAAAKPVAAPTAGAAANNTVAKPPVLAASNRPTEVVRTSPPLAPAASATPTTESTAAGTNAATPQASAKRGFLQQINPLNLFRGSEKTSGAGVPPDYPPASSKQETTGTGPAVSGTGSTAARKAPPGRYAYLNPAAPVAGNRAEAERFFAQGLDATQRRSWNEAVRAYTRACQQDPSLFEARYNLGLVATDAGNLPLALESYEVALVLRPTSLDARYNFALVLKQANYPTDAVLELEKVVARYPNETRAHLALANLYAQQFDQATKARPHYVKVLELEPQHPQSGAIRLWLSSNPSGQG